MLTVYSYDRVSRWQTIFCTSWQSAGDGAIIGPVDEHKIHT